jgi:uncharacterized protein YecE (DUF72 family)
MKQLSLLGAPPPSEPAERVLPAPADPALLALAARVPDGVHFGTSSWSFPGWSGIVYDGAPTAAALARTGLGAYGRHPLFRTVGVDRGFYAPIPDAELRAYAESVPPGFRFVIKAPAAVTDAAARDARGGPIAIRETFLDAALAIDSFIGPVTEILAEKAGPLVFQISPLASFASPERVIDALEQFLSALPRGPIYGVEVRDPELVGRRLLDALTRTGARYVVGVHARMPPAAVQIRFEGALPAGPFVARWSLLEAHSYESAKARFAPFDRLVVEDPVTRAALAGAVVAAARRGQPSFVVANNKAEGSAPLTLRKLAETVASPPP